MAFASREDLQTRLNALIGERDDDEALNFIKDSLETYDSKTTENGITKEEHERLMKEQDTNWRKRYKDTFFSGKPDESLLNPSSREDPLNDVPGVDENNPASYDDLFE